MLSRHIKLKYKKDLLIGLDSGLFKKCFFGKKKIKDTYTDLQLFGDVRSFDYKILNNIDHVIYLAAISNDPMGSKFINPTLDINFKSAIKLAKKCKDNNVKTFTFASSCSPYGFKNNFKNEK